MKNGMIIAGILMMLSWGGMLYIIGKGTREMEKNVGKTIVIDGDSLTIVNYYFWKKEYALSNGVYINEVLINKP